MHRSDLAQLLTSYHEFERIVRRGGEEAARRHHVAARTAILAELRAASRPMTVSLPGRRIELVLNRTGDGWVERAVGDGLRVYRQKERV